MTNHHEITDSQVASLTSLADTFAELQGKIDEELHKTGFRQSSAEDIEEPRITGSLVDRSEADLRRMYDLFVVYYDYITDHIVNYETRVKTAKAQVEAVKNTLTLEAAGIKRLSNADLRKAWVATHPVFLKVDNDYMYTRQVYDAQTERRKKLSASMKRIYQELFIRNPALQRSVPSESSGPSTNSRQAKNEQKMKMFERFRPSGGVR